MIKRKKQSMIIVSVFILILMLFTTTYAFFNYTRTGVANTIKVGRISFVTRQTETINLTNVFPIDKTTINTDTDNVDDVVIEIEGDTDYSDGIEYLVSSVDSNIYTTSGVLVPISLDVTTTGLGNNNPNYFTARDSKDTTMYKKIVGDTLVGDQMLLVGYIPKNTTSGQAEGVDGSITIKAYFDKDKILISDTYDGTESDNMGTTNSMAEGKTVITTNEWNQLQQNGVSFKIKVEANEGIWVNPSLEEIMRTKNYSETLNRGIRDNENSDYVQNETPGIDFGNISSDTNGKGVYMRAGTENDDYPILYYRGKIEDNNVFYANKCWKAVRTTDTGGVKLIYNGELSPVYDLLQGTPLEESEYTIIQDDYGFIYDQNEKKYVATMPSEDYELGYFSFNVPDGDRYYAKIEITGNHEYDYGLYYIDYDGSWNNYDYVNAYPYEKYWLLGDLTSTDTISFYDRLYDAYYGPLTIKIQIIKNVPNVGQGCDNTGIASQISLNINDTDVNTFNYNPGQDSPAYVGYMYGTVYEYSTVNWTSGAKFGSSFTWDGTNYKLVDATVTTPDATHHYSCNLTDSDETCTDLRYVYHAYGGKYYITLTGGDGIEEAFVKMNTNANDSNAKNKIDTWYANNLTSYTNKLEDTIWCNDRSFGNGNNNGWIANGGDLSTDLYYGEYQRSNYASNDSTVKNHPSLACTNKNDRFTVNNEIGNKALTYPVAMLTSDEMVLAGGVADNANRLFYLMSGSNYWSLSPNVFNGTTLFTGAIYQDGIVSAGATNIGYYGLRPAISIKPGQLIIKGTGTVADPYVIE